MANLHRWVGHFESTVYAKGHVFGDIGMKLPFDPRDAQSSEATVTYTGSYKKGSELTVPIKLNDVECKSANGQITHNININAQISFLLFFKQELNFTSTEIDIDKGKITGKYTSGFPSDSGTFKLIRLPIPQSGR